jgi:hypothetical protein
VTSQPLATADLHIREPKKPLPPQTTIFLAVAMLNWLSLTSHEAIQKKRAMSSMFCSKRGSIDHAAALAAATSETLNSAIFLTIRT